MKKNNWRKTELFNKYFDYNEEAGAAYINIPNKDRKIYCSSLLGGKIIVDTNKKGDIVGVEILNIKIK